LDIVLRDVTDNDFEWLYDLRTLTMSNYILESGDWFTRDSQSNRIIKEYKSIKIVRTGNQDIGMFKVKRQSDKLEIIQIQLLPEYQHMGIGSKLIIDLQIDASRQRMPIFLSVLKVNPARCLYKRLGFKIVREKEKSYTMRYFSE